MFNRFNKKSSLAVFILLSLAGHLTGGYFAGFLGPFDLRSPLPLLPAISVDLGTSSVQNSPPIVKEENARDRRQNLAASSDSPDKKMDGHASSTASDGDGKTETAARGGADEFPAQKLDTNSEVSERGGAPAGITEYKSADNADFNSIPVPRAVDLKKGTVRNGGEFVPYALEKLTYRVMLFGIPAGTAVLEATNKNGEVRITTTVKSNNVVSSIYPVDILVDTRLLVGNYLLTRIRQHEGSSFSDTGFTLMLREKNAFWVDRLKNRYANTPLPTEDVMDMISGFYYLRNQRLEVGKPVQLHLFDSCRYADTTVEVLRKERLSLPGLREADTLVVHPILTTDGFFHSSGNILVWLTDDEKKVPVKVEAHIPLGKVTAELVSAESEKTAEAAANNDVLKGSDQRLVKSPSVPLFQRGK